MKHTPYGYRIEDGKAVVDEAEAAAVREFFSGYISGLALMAAARKAGLELYHGSAGRMLRNAKYLGDDYYPAIISRGTFDRAEEVRMERARALGRVREPEAGKAGDVPTEFRIPAIKAVHCDPFAQAAYAYSMIESGVDTDGDE